MPNVFVSENRFVCFTFGSSPIKKYEVVGTTSSLEKQDKRNERPEVNERIGRVCYD